MKNYFLTIFRFVYFLTLVNFCCAVNSISGEIFAFLDVNYDRYTDLLVRRDSGRLSVYLSSTKDDASFAENADFAVNFGEQFRGEIVVNVGVGDFNGDSFADLLITSRIKNNPEKNQYNVAVCFGTGKNFKNCTRNNEKWTKFREQPTILNCGGPQKSLEKQQTSDFFVVNANGTRVCFLGNETAESFKEIIVFQNPNPTELYPNIAHGFVDITGDLNAEVVLLTNKNKSDPGLPSFEVWQRFDDQWNLVSLIPDPKDTLHPPQLLSSTGGPLRVGHVVFDDFNRDGRVDILLPFCRGECRNLSLLFCTFQDQKPCAWTPMDVPLSNEKHALKVSHTDDLGFPFVVRSGDYTQNGFPDLLIVLDSTEKMANGQDKVAKKAYFIANVDCYIAGSTCGMGREFRVTWEPVVHCANVQQAAFFDSNEDGTLDILYECKDDEESSRIDFTLSTYSGDTTFLKVEAYTATCATCLNGHEGSGISLPGATLKYVMIDTDGNLISSAYTQQTSTTYRSLLLPYALFGLGRSPNFIDKLHLGIPSGRSVNQTWLQIVPNSRMYIIPYEPDIPSHWIGRLYVTPGRLVWMSVSALGGVCALILITVLILHWYEVRVDRKEREAQRKNFHFDAM